MRLDFFIGTFIKNVEENKKMKIMMSILVEYFNNNRTAATVASIPT